MESWPADVWPWRDSLLVSLQVSVSPKPSSAGARRVHPWQMMAQLTLRDAAGRIIQRGPLFDGMYTGLVPGGDIRLPFSNNPFVAVGPRGIIFGPGRDFAFAVLDSAFRLSYTLRWPRAAEPLTDTEVTAVKEATLAGLPVGFPPSRAAHLFDDAMAPEILPAVRPAIGRVILAPGGEIWVERFEALRLGSRVRPASTHWTVLAPDGSPVAVLRLPRGTRLEDISRHGLAVVGVDSMDVEHVAVLQLPRG